MTNLRKHSYSKPNLIIDIQNFERKIQDFSQKHNKNQVTIKPLRSEKNVHQIKRFNFDDQNVQTMNHSQKLKKLQKLQQEKQSLIQSLQILKESAVCAIAEKQDQLQILRSKDFQSNQQRVEFYEIQLNISQKMRQQLQEECDKLYKQMKQQRQKYLIQLQQKQMFIEELHNEIMYLRRELQMLQHNDMIRTKKIKILQEENSKLSVELELINADNSMREKYQDVCSNLEGEDPFQINKNVSFSAILPDRNILSMLQTQHFFHSQEDKTFMSQKLQQINYQHRQELLDIKVHYEEQISALRQIYQRQLKLPTEESQVYSLRRKISKSRSHSNSMKSLTSPQLPESKKLSSQQGLNLNLNLKGMNTIIQNVQQFLQTQRYKINNLQNEIKRLNLSQCPSVQRLVTQQDNQSQFTSKYFEGAFNFEKKNKKVNYLIDNRTDNETKTILKTKRDKDQAIQENLVTQLQQRVQPDNKNLWEKAYLFVSGIVSGVAITSVAGYFFKK